MPGIHAFPRSAAMLSLALLLACDANLGSVAGSGSEGEGDDGSTTGEPGGPDQTGEPLVCVGGKLCPAGTRCANGLCASECSDDPECDADEYCGLDGLCHHTTVPSCNDEDDCAVTQTCVNQVCVALGESCDLYDFLDGCASNAVCVDDYDGNDRGVCREMPACAADQTCPIGIGGAVCNTGYHPYKDAICLIGMCVTVEHCPTNWMCIHFADSVLGECSNGVFSSPCTEPGHCLSGTCIPLPGTGGGFCA